MSRPERTFTISLFESEKDNAPKLVKVTFAELKAQLCAFEEREGKLGGACWSPGDYPPGARRGNANVESIGVGAFDIDHTTHADLEALFARLDEAKVPFVCHSTFSHTPSSPRARLVIELARSVTPAEWTLLFPVLVRKYGIPADDKAKDPARILFAPSCPPGAGTFVRVGSAS